MHYELWDYKRAAQPAWVDPAGLGGLYGAESSYHQKYRIGEGESVCRESRQDSRDSRFGDKFNRKRFA